MKRFTGIIIILLLLAVFLVLTNPGKDNFINWATQKAAESDESEVKQFFGDVLGRPLLTVATSREDYKFFSIFKINTVNEEKVYLGLLKNIFVKIK